MFRAYVHRLEILLLTVAAGAAVATVQCGTLDTTQRRRTSFAITVRGVNSDVTTSAGWRVAYERASIAIGPVRWYEGAPILGQQWPRRVLGFGVAYAHPGH